jgi:N-acetylmuramoyl-L-alanine amidase
MNFCADLRQSIQESQLGTPLPDYADQILRLVLEAQTLLHEVAIEPLALVQGQVDLGTLVLDPGHGGEIKVGGSSANNAISVSGVKEKKLTLEFCLLLRDLLLQQAAANGETIRVVLTRTADKNLGLAERAGFAFKERAKALICIHFNGMADPNIRGAPITGAPRTGISISTRTGHSPTPSRTVLWQA